MSLYDPDRYGPDPVEEECDDCGRKDRMQNEPLYDEEGAVLCGYPVSALRLCATCAQQRADVADRADYLSDHPDMMPPGILPPAPHSGAAPSQSLARPPCGSASSMTARSGRETPRAAAAA